MKITYRKLDQLYVALDACNNLSGVKFVYSVSKNMAKIEQELKLLEKAIEPSKDFLEYERKRIELNEKFCIKHPNGTPIREEGKYIYPEGTNPDNFFVDLNKEYEKTISKREKQISEFEKLMDTELDIDLHMLKQNDLPESITVQQMRGINAIVE